MKVPPELEKVEDFLDQFRQCSRPEVSISQYYKNLDFIQKSGITIEEIKEILLEKLSAQHYYKGPESDIDSMQDEGIIYHFKYSWEDFEIYIKLKVSLKSKEWWTAICLSIHD